MTYTLVLEKRGCNYWPGTIEEKESDLGNYRIVTTERIKATNGRTYFIEFGRIGSQYRWTNKRTGKALKHPVIEPANWLGIDTEYMKPETVKMADGKKRTYESCFRDAELEKKCRQKYHATKKDLLAFVNSISTVKYTDLLIMPEINLDVLPNHEDAEAFWKTAGYREKDIAAHLASFKWFTSGGHECVKLKAINGSSCVYAKDLKRFVG